MSAHQKKICLLDTIIVNMQQELNTNYESFNANQAKMSELVKETKTKELQDLQGRIRSFQTSARKTFKKIFRTVAANH
ncbi:MAG: hypothetical protein PHR81_10365 [Bacteroidales bacterium]|jgi:hypothetical protein|nr:hypothetical protein [Bacteroidales bacterium]MDD4215204.1 hypothetical protein [Bacteroidales bacterium]